ncbi:hypothetical protein SF23_04995 [Streptomyces sp. MBRL 10]|nr:hypothetical protein SF23_04995 [Streptomyces sp. MBRL 10]
MASVTGVEESSEARDHGAAICRDTPDSRVSHSSRSPGGSRVEQAGRRAGLAHDVGHESFHLLHTGAESWTAERRLHDLYPVLTATGVAVYAKWRPPSATSAPTSDPAPHAAQAWAGA